MKAPQDIILNPVITEASMGNVQQKKYTFRVAKDANKIEITKAVESLFPGTKVSEERQNCKIKLQNFALNFFGGKV